MATLGFANLNFDSWFLPFRPGFDPLAGGMEETPED